MKVSVGEKENVIKIGRTTWLDDLYIADHIVLLSPDSEKMQDRTDIIAKKTLP